MKDPEFKAFKQADPDTMTVAEARSHLRAFYSEALATTIERTLRREELFWTDDQRVLMKARQDCCVHCGKNVLGGRWEDTHTKGEFHLNVPSCLPEKVVAGAFDASAVGRGDWAALEESPVVKSFHGQDLVLEFGREGTRVCNACASKLAHLLGQFFGLAEEVSP